MRGRETCCGLGRIGPILAATGFEIVTADFDRRLYGAYTCIKSS